MSLWGRVFAALYDGMLADTEAAGLADRRHHLLADVSGSVLDLGAGTGANLRHYPRTGIDELVLVEPEEPMARRLEPRAADSGRPARVVRAPAEELPFPDQSFDTVVSTLVLCTVRDQPKALAEVRRVLKPGGRLLFLEHVRAEDPEAAKWQDRIHPLWVRLGHGCHCNRSTLATIEASGFTVDRVENGRMPKAPKIVRPMIVGTATWN